MRLKTSPLSEDASLVEKWGNNQPNPKELFKRFTFDEMKSALEKWLSPEEEDSGEEVVTPVASQPSTNFSLDTSKAKQSKVDQFDSLFDDKASNKVDDLPF